VRLRDKEGGREGEGVGVGVCVGVGEAWARASQSFESSALDDRTGFRVLEGWVEECSGCRQMFECSTLGEGVL
jgi:hypothetical protein